MVVLIGLATRTALRRSELARDQQQAQNCAYDVAPFSARPAGCALHGASLAFAPCSHSIGPAGRSIGFALLGESLFPNARMAGPSKVTKNACPCTELGVPGSLRSTSLIPSLLRGSPRKGHPCRRRPRPFTALAASMPLAPLRSDSIRPPERGVRRRLVGRAMEKQKGVSTQGCVTNGFENSVGWKTAKHFPPQSTQRLVSNFADEKRWVSFALPTARFERGAGRRLATSSSANKQSSFVSLFTLFQAARTQFPFRRPNAGAAQGDARHGCRARSDGTWMSLRDDPRGGAGARGVLQSKTRMQGWPSFWLLFLGHTRKSDSPSKAKPMLQQTSATDPRIPGQRPSRANSLLQKPTQKHRETFASEGLIPIALNRQSTVRRPCVCA
ncbi:hypothetical protein A9A72_1241214 [Stutzerimonas stutzeri]|uniref:Uncharacterized protein n=1 Tax=Stutzerimonas stutzeri TaxID=316 RepID=A0A5S5B810_STUST|nr:hypothetical protein A9A72_1241214 [Stutzerimonas stutzeri]